MPVGEDRNAHLRRAGDFAGNVHPGSEGPGVLPEPRPMMEGPGARVVSRRDGTVKMSKSDPSGQSRINLTDDADVIAAKIRRARTDPAPLPETVEQLEGRPEADNLVGIYAALSGRTKDQVLSQYGGQGFGQAFKPRLAGLLVWKRAPG